MNYPKISIVIGSFNRSELLKLCIDAIRKELQDQSYEIIVVDGGSNDGALEWLTSQKDIISIIQHNRGEWGGKEIERKPWAYFMNLAFKAASGKFICMLSDDTLIVPGAINEGVNFFEKKLDSGINVGAVAFYFRDFPKRKKYAVAMNLGNIYVNHGLYLNKALKEVDYIDESYHFYFADTDLSLKIKSHGYECLVSKKSFVEHYFEATPEIRTSNNDERKIKDRQKLIDKWKGIAYPEEKYDRFCRHIGRWDNHKEQFDDATKTVEKLVYASHPEIDFILPPISVVTIVRNDKEGMHRTLESVINQTYPFIEYIVIDGNSTDGTTQLLQDNLDYINVLVSEKDEGIYDAMNKGIKNCTGRFAIFMNAGDTFSEFASLYNFISAAKTSLESDIIYGDNYYVNLENSEKSLRKAAPISTICRRMPFNHQSCLFSLDALRSHPFNKTFKYAADYEQIVQLYKHGFNFTYVPLPLADFYAGGASESGLRPYLEVLKIQLDNFDKDIVESESVYFEAFKKNFHKLIGPE